MKKTLSLVFLVLMTCVCALSVAACGEKECEHAYGEWKVVIEATCDTEGVKTRKCTKCNSDETESVAALGHNYSTEWTVDEEAECEKAGSKSLHCLNGGCDSKIDVTPITALGHNYSTEWTVDEEAECEKAGSKSRHCLNGSCDSKIDVTPIAALTHDVDEEELICKNCKKEYYTTGIKFTLVDAAPSYYEVTDVGTASSATEIIIPKKHDGKVVASIGSSAFRSCTATSITLPSTITSIGKRAFYACKNLTEITLPFGVTSIGDEAFYGCTSLSEVSLPDGITDMGSGLFYGCTVLSRLVLPTDATSIADKMFYGCTRISEVNIPSGITTVGESAFFGCTGVTKVVIPTSITSIGISAFGNCSGIKKVNYLGLIDDWVQIQFCSDDNIVGGGYDKTTGRAANPTYYAKDLYISDARVTEVNLTTATAISGNAFVNCNSIAKLNTGAATSIGSFAFYGCKSLSEVTLGTDLTNIKEVAFLDCTALSKVNYLGTLDEWATITMSPCGDANITHRTLLDYAKDLHIGGKLVTEAVISAEKINDYAFCGCKSITSVTLNESVNRVGKEAFYDCNGIIKVAIGSGVQSIGTNAFKQCYSLTEVIDRSSLNVEVGSSANGYVGYYAYGVCSDEQQSKISTSGDGYVIYTGEAEKILIKYVGDETTVTVPSTVTAIKSYAFYGRSQVTNIKLPTGIARIEAGAFEGCNNLKYNEYGNAYYLGNDDNNYVLLVKATSTGITTCEINANTKFISNDAFKSCSKLSSVEIPDSVSVIGDSAFYACSGLTSVTVGNGVTTIGEKAFYYCNGLASITIGSKVNAISKDAFAYCSALKSIYYKGEATEWSEVNVESGNTNVTKATVYYYSESRPAESGNYWHYDADGKTIVVW